MLLARKLTASLRLGARWTGMVVWIAVARLSFRAGALKDWKADVGLSMYAVEVVVPLA